MTVSCSLLVTCWERADLFALSYVMISFVVCHLPMRCPGSGVVLVSVPELCRLPYFFVNLLFQFGFKQLIEVFSIFFLLTNTYLWY